MDKPEPDERDICRVTNGVAVGYDAEDDVEQVATKSREKDQGLKDPLM